MFCARCVSYMASFVSVHDLAIICTDSEKESITHKSLPGTWNFLQNRSQQLTFYSAKGCVELSEFYSITVCSGHVTCFSVVPKTYPHMGT